MRVHDSIFTLCLLQMHGDLLNFFPFFFAYLCLKLLLSCYTEFNVSKDKDSELYVTCCEGVFVYLL